MSIYIPTSTTLSKSYVDSQDQKAVKKTQLTTTGAPNGVIQADSNGTITSGSGGIVAGGTVAVGTNNITQSSGNFTQSSTGKITSGSGGIVAVGTGATNYTPNGSTGSVVIQQTGTTTNYGLIVGNTGSGVSTNGLLLQNYGTGASSTINLDMCSYKNTTAAFIPNVRMQALDDGAASSHIVFFTKIPGNISNALTERFRITSAGNVTQSGSTSITSGSSGITCNGTLAMGTNNITQTSGNFTQSSSGAITTGTSGLTCNGDLTLASGKNITQSGASSITTGSGGLISGGKISLAGQLSSTTQSWASGSGAGQYQFNTGAGTTPTSVTITGSDVSGSIAFTTGSDASTGGTYIITINFHSSFATNSNVIIVPCNAASALVTNSIYLECLTNQFSLRQGTNLQNSTAYSWNWIALGH